MAMRGSIPGIRNMDGSEFIDGYNLLLERPDGATNSSPEITKMDESDVIDVDATIRFRRSLS